MQKSGNFQSWIILFSGIASLGWTILLHGQYFGFQELIHRNSSLLLILVTLLLMVAVWLIYGGHLLKKGFFNRISTFIMQNSDYLSAVLLPTFFFALLFLFSRYSLHPFWTFVHQLSLPLQVYFLLLLLLWFISAVRRLLSSLRGKPAQIGNVLLINRDKVQRSAWALFIFLAVSNFLASFLISISKTGILTSSLSSHFLVENETSIYTYASSLFLGLSALGFGLLAYFSSKMSLRLTWAGLGILFLAFSIDEVIAMHEELIAALRLLGSELTSSVFTYLIPVVLIILVIVALAMRVLITNRVEHWVSLLLGFVMFFGGAVLVESFSEYLEIVWGEGHLPLLLIKPLLFLEEGLELSGTYLIFFFVLDQFFGGRKQVKVTIGLSSDPPPGP